MKARRQLVRMVRPFAVANRALAACALRLEANEDFSPTVTTFDLDPISPDESRGLHPELRLELDPEATAREARIDADSIQLALSEEQPMAKINRLITRWPLGEIPRTYSFEIPADAYGQEAMEIRLSLVLSGRRSRKPADVTAWRPGSVLDERSWIIKRPTTRTLLPVENTSFESRGWDRNALWFIEFQDLASPQETRPEEYLQIHLNKDLPALQRLWAPSARRDPARRVVAGITQLTIAGSILSEMSVSVLGSVYIELN